MFSSFVSSSLPDFPDEPPQSTNPPPPHSSSRAPCAVAAIMSDDAASLVLDYLCATGRLPDDDDDAADVHASALRPLLSLRTCFLPSAVFSSVRNFVMESHPGVAGVGSAASASLGAGFRQTRGFVLRFSGEAGCRRFRDHPWVKPGLLPFFDEAVDRRCNAFVVNVLLCSPAMTGGGKGSSLAVGWHRDATLGLKAGADAAGVKPRLAHSVTALYLVVPEGMIGGELMLRKSGRPLRFGRGEKEEEEEAATGDEDAGPVADEIVTPKENVAAIFRGDAEHAVRTFFTRSTSTTGSGGSEGTLEGMRVSVVLEQYKVPIGDVPWLVEFEVVNSSNYVGERFSESRNK